MCMSCDGDAELRVTKCSRQHALGKHACLACAIGSHARIGEAHLRQDCTRQTHSTQSLEFLRGCSLQLWLSR